MTTDQTQISESKLRERLINAASADQFFTEISLLIATDHDLIPKLLTQIHNEELSDVIAIYAQLKNDKSGPDFFLIRQCFETALPDFIAPVQSVMSCIRHLAEQAGQDMMASSVISKFGEFCKKDPSRLLAALDIIEASPQSYGKVLYFVLQAGSQVDADLYEKHAIRIATGTNGHLRQFAITAIGAMRKSNQSKSVEALENCCKDESTDVILGSIISSAIEVSCAYTDPLKSKQLLSIVINALNKGGPITLYAASQAVMFNAQHFAQRIELLDVVMDRLVETPPEHAKSIDSVLYALLTHSCENPALSFLEKFLPKLTNDSLTTKLSSTSYHIQSNTLLLSRVITRFLASDDTKLGRAAADLTSRISSENYEIAADRSECDFNSDEKVLQLARKAVGNLFATPRTVASFIVSLMDGSSDAVLTELANLLFDPLLLSYPDLAKDLRKSSGRVRSDRIETAICKACEAIEEYLSTLRKIPVIPELRPSIRNVESYNRHQHEVMSEVFKKAQSQSIFMSIVQRSLILYGTKSVSHQYTSPGTSQRMEIPLKSHGVTIDYPRMETIDPIGLNYRLMMLKAGRSKS